MMTPEERAAFVAGAKLAIEARRGNPYCGFYRGLVDMARAFVYAGHFPSGSPEKDAVRRAEKLIELLRDIGIAE